MKAKLHLMLIAAFLLTVNFTNAQISADYVDSSSGVTYPANAVSADTSDYALISLPISLSDSSTLKFGFSQYGFQSMTCSITLQQDNGLLTANILNGLSLYLYDSSNNLISEKHGFSLGDVNVLDGTQNKYTLTLKGVKTANKIAYAKLVAQNTLTANYNLRIYGAKLKFSCPAYVADTVVKATNVNNAANAVSSSLTDYATFAPPLLGSSSLTLRFPSAGSKDVGVSFIFGKGNTLINANLLGKIVLSIYDKNGKKLAADSNFTLADVSLLDSDKFSILLKVAPATGNKISSINVKVSSLLGFLTTLKFYYASVGSTLSSYIKPIITPDGGTVCPGKPLVLTATTSHAETVTWQWYKDNILIKNATKNYYTFKQPGKYFVRDEQDGCQNLTPFVVITQGTCKEVAPEQSYVLKTYPNPFNSYTILSLNDLPSKAQISVTDKAGNTIQTISTVGGQQIKLLQNAGPGLYFINVITESGSVYSTKVIKQ